MAGNLHAVSARSNGPEAIIQQLFPKATRIGAKLSDFPVYPVYQLQQLLGYAYESTDLSDLPGFAGKPIKLMIGLDAEGRFSGVKVLDHHEPVFLHGLGPQPLLDFVSQYAGHSLTESFVLGHKPRAPGVNSGTVHIDGVTKATVSVIIINDTILSTALQVARSKLESFALPPAARVRETFYEPLTPLQLFERDYLQRWQLERPAVERALGQALDSYAPFNQSSGDGELSTQLFSELYFSYLNAPIIGRNVLGDGAYQSLMQSLGKGDQVIAVWSRGPYLHSADDFKPGSVSERLGLAQQDLAIELRDLNALDEGQLLELEGLPEMERVHLFRIKGLAGFNPAAGSELRLNVELSRNHLVRDIASFSHAFQFPPQLFELVEQASVPAAKSPIWLTIWQDRWWQVAILLASLGLLTTLFVGQRRWVTMGAWLTRTRWMFLTFTLLFIGFYAQGQLSVVNIYTLLLALYEGFDITLFLLDPVIFILWSYTFISLFLWGRGLYCGWLCPFGALQEMLSWLAAKLKIRQWRISPRWHRRGLWLKYLLLVGLVSTAFASLSLAERLAEVEPFKTSITLGFDRYWPFVLYALALLALGLFVHKFYCRYLCPLGAGLAIIGRLRRFSWLDRIDLCGAPCQRCRHRCGIGAIRRDGSVDYDECIQCLECVIILHDPGQCVAALQRRKQRTSSPTPVPAEGPQPLAPRLSGLPARPR
ncbi:4Fe-4S binding protein [Motiliproteus sp. SC1-56]|uniref:4Fe-4S binding protein n=1 Tax=Motiliproteus sp. SC1-56 TaxID=2799565 RepID=UPI001A8DF13F